MLGLSIVARHQGIRFGATLANTGAHSLRKAVRVVNQTLNGLGLEKHPEKTFIGRIEREFDVLGCHLRLGRFAVAQKTVERFVERASRLYERKPGETFDPPGWVGTCNGGSGGPELGFRRVSFL